MKLLKLILFLGVIATACEVPAQTVYVTKTGEKYHKSSCHYLKNSKKEITLEKAIERGMTACSICKPVSLKTKTNPTESINTLYTDPTTASPKSPSSQCTGKTKAGARCKRMTKSANGRCYQHE